MSSLKDRRAALAAAVERAIVVLDVMDGDPDLEDQCEDEGGACEDEGFDSDREAEQGDMAVNYARLADGTEDQTRPLLWGSF